eukprot:NODE_5853_length_602_cov_4.640000_g5688_i0.p1 GENE.NODE_5853_length_602_cov_4.640000_g5688_i0~~NODE_5853_length_602_cov_4.640000_g5688_i0.p1  ORF type:complete len:193 (-),score=63.85 NODE_5853_length_602_cov_4.640000_g5688_i0:23-559(-)
MQSTAHNHTSGSGVQSPAKYHMEARVGRQKQRYTDAGERQVAGCIPMRMHGGEIQVLMLTSRRGKKMIFPKGGWDADETVDEAAVRECWEEGGVTGVLDPSFKFTTHFTSHNHERSHITMFLLYVDCIHAKWPEPDRTRSWLSLTECEANCHHEWMLQLLQHLPPAPAVPCEATYVDD